MARESVQKLQPVRPPRVQVTYDVEIGDAIEIKELPSCWVCFDAETNVMNDLAAYVGSVSSFHYRPDVADERLLRQIELHFLSCILLTCIGVFGVLVLFGKEAMSCGFPLIGTVNFMGEEAQTLYA